MRTHVTFILTMVGVFLFLSAQAQSKKDIEQRLQSLEKANFGALTDINTLKGDVLNLQNELSKIRSENESLKQQVSALKSENAALKTQSTNPGMNALSQPASSGSDNTINQSSSPGRCKAITSNGTQCSRNADPGSEYCWQHKKTYEPDKTPSNFSAPAQNSSGGRVIHTGPRGGKYYINSNGNKTYIKR